MKRILPYLFLLGVLILLIIQQPNENEFYSWLEDTHQLSCGSFTCTQSLNNKQSSTYLEVGSFIEKGYLIFHTIDKTYEKDDGSLLNIKVIGILGNYIPIVQESS
ncbi:hypothetical protein [Bacillus sp. 2205SS5-2]|uniref:hypothetical protein n=1 Tax=Bacillus sp. 2205SS5-2 TaxID=3109031 RepID=UPI003007CD1D